MIATEKEFYWNEDTIHHFYFMSSYLNKEQVREAVTNFVEADCDLEENETEEDLITDLIRQIYE